MNSILHEENSLHAESIKWTENVSSYCFIKRFTASVNLKKQQIIETLYAVDNSQAIFIQ